MVSKVASSDTQQSKTAANTYRLKFGMCTLVARILIGVVLYSELTIGLLYLELGGARLNAEGIVVFRFFDHLVKDVVVREEQEEEEEGKLRRHR